MDALDAFLDELRAAGSAVDAPAPSDALQVLFRDGTVASPPAPLPQRRRPLLRVAVAGAAGAFAFSGLGVAGALPAPVQSRVADVVEHVGVNIPDGNPGHGGQPPAAPPAEGKPRQHQKNQPGTVDEQHRNDDAPTVTGDDHSDKGRHLGQEDGTTPPTPAGNGPSNDGAGASDDGHGFHRGWPHMPPVDFGSNQGPPDTAASDNRGGSN
jgi:hypothetical protein